MKFHVNGGGYENAWFSGNGFRPLQKKWEEEARLKYPKKDNRSDRVRQMENFRAPHRRLAAERPAIRPKTMHSGNATLPSRLAP